MRPTAVTAALALITILAASCLSLARQGQSNPPPAAMVPAYFYPAGPGLAAWHQLAKDARTRTIEVILNPASGPGEKPDPTFVKLASQIRKAGGKVIGYISTNYAKREIAAVEQDFRSYLSFYELDGIFLDEMPGQAEFAPYYLQIRTIIKSAKPDFQIVGNPGQPWVDESYMKAADCLVMFEGDLSSFAKFNPQQVSPWTKKYPASRFAVVVHTVQSPAAMRKAIQKAQSTRAGWVYITNREMPNPYDALPTYWPQELREIEAH